MNLISFNTAGHPHCIIHGGSQSLANSRINRTCVCGDKHGHNCHHMTETSVSPAAFSSLRQKREARAHLAFCKSNSVRPPGFLPGAGVNINADTLQSVKVTTVLPSAHTQAWKEETSSRGEEQGRELNRSPQNRGQFSQVGVLNSKRAGWKVNAKCKKKILYTAPSLP